MPGNPAACARAPTPTQAVCSVRHLQLSPSEWGTGMEAIPASRWGPTLPWAWWCGGEGSWAAGGPELTDPPRSAPNPRKRTRARGLTAPQVPRPIGSWNDPLCSASDQETKAERPGCLKVRSCLARGRGWNSSSDSGKPDFSPAVVCAPNRKCDLRLACSARGSCSQREISSERREEGEALLPSDLEDPSPPAAHGGPLPSQGF